MYPDPHSPRAPPHPDMGYCPRPPGLQPLLAGVRSKGGPPTRAPNQFSPAHPRTQAPSPKPPCPAKPQRLRYASASHTWRRRCECAFTSPLPRCVCGMRMLGPYEPRALTATTSASRSRACALQAPRELHAPSPAPTPKTHQVSDAHQPRSNQGRSTNVPAPREPRSRPTFQPHTPSPHWQVSPAKDASTYPTNHPFRPDAGKLTQQKHRMP